MRYILSFCLIATLCSNIQAQLIDVPNEVPYGTNPKTPSKVSLDRIAEVNYEVLVKTHSTFLFNNKAFNGWAIQIYDNNDHKYRYTKYLAGKAVWQIGYFDNGDIGHDFHILDGENYGSQRMWRKGGIGYIDTYFQRGGHQHGKQMRWHSNGQLEWVAEYQSGLLISEIKYDTDGNEVTSSEK